MKGQTTGLTRDILGTFLPDPRTIRAFENLDLNQVDIITTVTGVQEAPLLALALSDVLEADRKLVDGLNVVFSDGGAKGDVAFDLTDTGVSPANYGSATKTVQIAVDVKGRITLAAEYVLNSDNVTEGVTNLYFTQTRARNSVSATGAGLTYNAATGAFSLNARLQTLSATVPAADGTYLAPTSITISGGIITAIS